MYDFLDELALVFFFLFWSVLGSRMHQSKWGRGYYGTVRVLCLLLLVAWLKRYFVRSKTTYYTRFLLFSAAIPRPLCLNPSARPPLPFRIYYSYPDSHCPAYT